MQLLHLIEAQRPESLLDGIVMRWRRHKMRVDELRVIAMQAADCGRGRGGHPQRQDGERRSESKHGQM